MNIIDYVFFFTSAVTPPRCKIGRRCKALPPHVSADLRDIVNGKLFNIILPSIKDLYSA